METMEDYEYSKEQLETIMSYADDITVVDDINEFAQGLTGMLRKVTVAEMRLKGFYTYTKEDGEQVMFVMRELKEQL